MAEIKSSPFLRRIAGMLLFGLWAGAIADMAWNIPEAIAVSGLTTFVLISLIRGSRQTRLVCGALAGAIVALGWTFGVADAAFAGIDRALRQQPGNNVHQPCRHFQRLA